MSRSAPESCPADCRQIRLVGRYKDLRALTERERQWAGRSRWQSQPSEYQDAQRALHIERRSIRGAGGEPRVRQSGNRSLLDRLGLLGRVNAIETSLNTHQQGGRFEAKGPSDLQDCEEARLIQPALDLGEECSIQIRRMRKCILRQTDSHSSLSHDFAERLSSRRIERSASSGTAWLWLLVTYGHQPKRHLSVVLTRRYINYKNIVALGATRAAPVA